MNESAPVHLYDSHFQSQHAAKCDLLIRLSSNRVSYAIVDQLQDQLKAFYDAPLDQGPAEHLQMLSETDPLFKFHYRRVKVVPETRKFTFIPSDVYSDDMLTSYSAFLNIREGEEVRLTHLRKARLKNLIGLSKQVRDAAIHTFINPLFFGQADVLIESLLKFYYQETGLRLAIQLNGNTFEALYMDGKKVLFYNIFDNQSADEFNYFLLTLMGQAAINAAETPVLLTGEITRDDERYRRLAKYFKTIGFTDTAKLMKISDEFGELRGHRYYSVLSQNICE
ncbi:DUF3822 family protein [Hufsiella ginkgonis]|uniref:DUF3822 family protein n=1 Tax=Hufsiella ginkgonis TaxID=2695274 RepID=A0A7K1Y123_9SPHI|nr:DUF3822 family protein [Hufsiella ginkgonis]MXV16807.1 DUF3822 family protein [Hufsiella ginkgonis]